MLSRIKRVAMCCFAAVLSVVSWGGNNIKASAEKLNTVSYAYVETYELPTSTNISTDEAYINAERWGHVSTVSDFIDNNGFYSVVYEDGGYVLINRFSSDMTLNDTVTIKKLYPLLGGVVNDNTGNYYIIWGQDDDTGKGSIATVAISKYDYSGTLVTTTSYVTDIRDTGAWDEYLKYRGSWATKHPFDAGNCSMTIQNGILICFIGRGMYNGHQSSAVYAVNTTDMSKNYDYFTYSSHSFNQRVISLSDGGVLFCDHGDAYPRAFKLSKNEDTEIEPFHFVDTNGSCNNDTYAELGGICELDSGYVLVGSSIKSEDRNENKQLFMQLVNKDLTRTVSGGSSRSVKVGGRYTTDYGVIWLTDYQDGSARNINICKTDNNQFVVMWEKCDLTGYLNSYYMVLNGNGEVVTPITYLGVRTNGSEELKIYNNCLYWSTADNSKSISIHKMCLYRNLQVSYQDTYTYKGKAIKPAVTIYENNKVLSKGRDYKISYNNNESIGTAVIAVTGMNGYKHWRTNIQFNIVIESPSLTYKKISNEKIILSWTQPPCPNHREAVVIGSSKSNELSYSYRFRSCPTEYEVYVSRNGDVYKKIASIDGNKTSCTMKNIDLTTDTYKVKIRAIINGDDFTFDWAKSEWIMSKTYSDYSNVIKVK